VVIDLIPWGTADELEHRLALIQEAISSQRVMRFLYRNSRGESTDREVEPMTLVFKPYLWYLFACC
jgi:predicted DNA-binding transcriptional regulator YafY